MLSMPAGQSFSIYSLASVLPFLAAKQRPTDRNDWMTSDAEIVMLLAQELMALLGFFVFLDGDEVHWAYALALSREALERCGLLVRIARLVGIEAKLLRQALRNDFEFLDGLSRELGTSRLLRFRSRTRRGTTFARIRGSTGSRL